jgi:hypothetical protein
MVAGSSKSLIAHQSQNHMYTAAIIKNEQHTAGTVKFLLPSRQSQGISTRIRSGFRS